MRTCAKWTVVFGVMSALLAPSASAVPELPPITATLSGYQACRTASTVNTNEIPWAQARLRPDQVWQHTQGSGVTVAVVDSGVNATSSALAGRVTNSGDDCTGHGTFVAGLIAAAPRPGGGFSGIAPASRILAVPATDQKGNTTAGQIAGGIRSAVASGARVIQVSASVTSPDEGLAAAVRDASAAGAIVVAPASVGSRDQATAAYPGAYPEVLAVASIGPDGNPLRGVKPEIKVDIAAPGGAMPGIGPGGDGLFIAADDAIAAAQVSGSAALVLSYRPALKAQEVVRRLRDTAYPTPGPSPLLGSGIVDPVSAVTAELPVTGNRPPAIPAAVHMPPPVDETPQVTAVVVASVAAAITGIVVVAGVVIPRGRKRSWRPADR